MRAQILAELFRFRFSCGVSHLYTDCCFDELSRVSLVYSVSATFLVFEARDVSWWKGYIRGFGENVYSKSLFLCEHIRLVD